MKKPKNAPEFEFPMRRYSDGPKKLVAIRLPAKLMSEIEAIADRGGWSNTDIISTALDQFVVWAKGKK